MNIQEKLTLLETLTNMNQAELARELGVTHAAYNRWRNGHAQPRAKRTARIDTLLSQHTGTVTLETTDGALREALMRKQAKHPSVFREMLAAPDILEQFILSLTYNSNRIEGSTLSEAETASVLFQNTPPRNKTVVEILEAKNHRAALEHLFAHLKDEGKITEQLTLRLHEILMNGIRDDAGTYRTHAVRIVGSYVPTANHLKVPTHMQSLAKRMQTTPKDIIKHLAVAHAQFEQIHPFSDGNGRVGRLLMHALALQANLPPVFIEERRKQHYLKHLNRAQLENDTKPLEQFIIEALLRSYAIVERVI